MKISDFPSIKGVDESESFITMLSPEMLSDPGADIKPLVELAAAILLDKPIAIIEMDGIKTPKHLRRIADKVIVWEDAAQVADEMKEWMDSRNGS